MNKQKILLSMELPYLHVQDFSDFEDLGFCIAPYVKKHSFYQEYYASYLKRRKDVIIDNGLYETGSASSWDVIFDAAGSMCSTHVMEPVIIAPDEVGNSLKTYEKTTSFREEADKQGFHRIGAVVHGDSLEKMCQYYQHLVSEGYSPVCLSFLTPRIDLLRQLRLEHDIWLHFLGMYSLTEFRWMRQHICLPKKVSMDTVKPIKCGFHKIYLQDSIRGLGTWDPGWELDGVQLHYARFAARQLKMVLQKEDEEYLSLDREISSETLGQGKGSFHKEGKYNGKEKLYPY